MEGKSLSQGFAGIGFSIAAFLGLLQSWVPSMALVWNGPSWSLSTEAFFYLLFPFVLPLLGRVKKEIIVLCLFVLWNLMLVPACIYVVFHPGDLSGNSTGLDFMKFFPLLRLPEFLMGILLGRLFLSNVAAAQAFRFAAPLAALACILVLVMSRRIPGLILHNGLLDPVFAVLLFSLCKWSSALSRLLSARFMVFLGEASYALYLLHQPLMSWFNSIFKRLGFEHSFWLFTIYVLLAVAFSCLVFIVVERPLRRRIMAFFERKNERDEGARRK